MIITNRKYSIVGYQFLTSMSPYSMNEISYVDDSYSFAKTYIKFGHECSICLEGVTSNLNAWKTNCGHVFHKKCLTKYYDITLTKHFCCPYCRGSIFCFDWWACDVYEWLSCTDNFLDQVHYFELYKDMIPQNICTTCDNIIGFTKHCFGCKEWRRSPELTKLKEIRSKNACKKSAKE